MRTKIIIAVVAIVVLVAVYFLFFHKKAPLAKAKVGGTKVSGSPSNSIGSLAISGIKALTGSPTAIKSDITFTDEEGQEDMAASDSDDDS